MVVRFVYRKRVDLAIEAVALLRERGIAATLNLVGSGELEQQLRGLVRGKNAGEFVNFLGAIEHRNLPEIYRSNDIYLMCSESEGMSNSLLEAISTGMPVVSSACEGSDELVRGNGIVVPRQEAALFAGSLARFIEEPFLFAQCSRAADELAGAYSTAANANSYLELYREILAAVAH
jgi:glycosyltransferase involved in cell wall biosynthesis